jgi:hypothetical protein
MKLFGASGTADHIEKVMVVLPFVLFDVLEQPEKEAAAISPTRTKHNDLTTFLPISEILL